MYLFPKVKYDGMYDLLVWYLIISIPDPCFLSYCANSADLDENAAMCGILSVWSSLFANVPILGFVQV